jgi:hypothetical protein
MFESIRPLLTACHHQQMTVVSGTAKLVPGAVHTILRVGSTHRLREIRWVPKGQPSAHGREKWSFTSGNNSR